MYLRMIATVLTVLSLSGCQQPSTGLSNIRLPPDARASLGSIEVIVSQFQLPIFASSMPTQGTNLASGIASGLNTNLLKERVELVNKALATFDYADDSLKATQQAFARVDTARLRVSPTVLRSQQPMFEILKASSADAVLIFNVHYSLSSDRALQFVGILALVPKSEALRKFRPDPTARIDGDYVIFRTQKGLTLYFSGADEPKRVRSEFDKAAGELAAWAATEANALLK